MGGDDLREPGADGRDRPSADARGRRGGARPLGARARRDRRGDRDAASCVRFWEDEVVGEIPARLLTDECPRYEVAQSRRAATPEREIVGAPPAAEALVELLASPALRSREFVFRRYDQLVGSRTVRRPGLDAAVLRLRPSMRGLALSLDGQGRIARLDPFTGGALAVLEAARNVACAGGEPIGFTDCLNFGNPGEARDRAGSSPRRSTASRPRARRSALPIVSGNVSLYNETNGRAIHPTPVVGAVGLVEDVRRVPKGWREGDSCSRPSPRRSRSRAPSTRRASASSAGRRRRSTSRRRRGSSRSSGAPPRCATLVHDAAEGGLAVCLAEAALYSGCGARARRPARIRSSSSARSADAPCSRARPTRGSRRASELAIELGVPIRGRRRRPEGIPCSAWSSSGSAKRLGGQRLACVASSESARGARRLASRVLRAVRAPAPRPGVGGHRGLRRRAPHRRSATWASSPRSSTSSSSRRCRARSRSGTRATRRPARTAGRTRSRSSTTAARARSRSATTATS